jgi:ABC-type multidrug transport system ATPase subunit
MYNLKFEDFKLFIKESNELLLEANFEIKNFKFLMLQANNGTGKTQLIESLLGINDKCYAEGLSSIEKNANEFRRANINYISQNIDLEGMNLSGYKYFRYLCYINKVEVNNLKLENLLSSFYSKDFNIKKFLKSNFKNMSGGEKKILHICCYMVLKESSNLVIIDEPFNNLEVRKVTLLSNLILNMINNGIAFIIISHFNFIPNYDYYFTIENKKLIQKETAFVPCLGNTDAYGMYKEVT